MLASSVSALISELAELKNLLQDMKVEAAIRDERQKQIAEALNGIKSIARWTLMTFIGAIIVAFAGFVIGGGLRP